MLFVVGEKTKIDSDKNRIAILLSNEKSTQLPHSNQIWKASKDCVNISGSRGRTGDPFFRYQVVNYITSCHNVRSQFGYFRKKLTIMNTLDPTSPPTICISLIPTDIGDRIHMFRRREVAVCFSPMSIYIPNILAALHY